MRSIKTIFILFLLLSLTSACGKKSPTENKDNPPQSKRTNNILTDTLATAETIALFKNLQQVAKTAVLFGHQEDVAYGVGWWAEPGRSDVKEVCGDYPAVYGWDLGDIHKDANLDGVDFWQMRQWVKQIYKRGGINTFSMHLDNPVSGGDAWDNAIAVPKILPGGSHHASYLVTLDKIADYLKTLTSDDGKYIPVILRPYHEHNHTWPWWGSSACSADEYNALWRMTVAYLRDTKGLHHLLYAISPQEVGTEADYLARYPGDAWVDILGMDYYLLTNQSRVTDLGKALAMLGAMAERKGKISALTEVGYEKVPLSDYWTNYLLAAVTYNTDAKKTAWALVWRNASTSHFFAPYPGQLSAADFVKFYQDPFTMFEKDLPKMYQ